MKTMKAPTMDVVRFTESDVIVASTTHRFVSLLSLGNSDYSDNEVKGNGFEFTFSAIHEGELQNIIRTDSIFDNNSESKSLADLIDETAIGDPTSYSSFNGNYEYDSTFKKYVKYNAQ